MEVGAGVRIQRCSLRYHDSRAAFPLVCRLVWRDAVQTPTETKPHSVGASAAAADRPVEPSSGWTRLLPGVFVSVGTVLLGIALVLSRNWPLLHDAAIMHYVVFLMDHGWRPWADIIDINMPGSYMVEWFAVHVFGGGNTAWRLFDIATSLAVIASAIAIPSAGERWGGFIGGIGIVLFHISNGPNDVGERDWFLMMFLLAGTAFYLSSLRQKRPARMAGFAALTGFAAAIKPPAVLFPLALLGLTYVLSRRRHFEFARYLHGMIAGSSIPILLVAAFLLRYQNLHAFLSITRGLVPYYAGHENHPPLELLRFALTPSVMILAALAGLLAFIAHTWKRWDMQVLLIGFAFGALLYVGQGKGWQYHKETMFAFLLIWLTIQLAVAMKLPTGWRILGAAGATLLCLLMGRYVVYVKQQNVDLQGTPAIEASLQRLGGASLSGDVQCVEMVSGCIGALYNLKLLPSSGFVFDSFLFTPTPTPAIEALRSRFLSVLIRKVPRVVIVTESRWNDGTPSFNRIAEWPAFRDFLAQQYVLDGEHDSNGQVVDGSYRVYLRK